MWCFGSGEKQTDRRTITKVKFGKTGVLFYMFFEVKEMPRISSRFAHMDR